MNMALFPPLVADFLLILTGVISIVALVAAAYSWSINIGQRKQLDQFAAIEAELEKVKRDLRNLNSKMVPPEQPAAGAESATALTSAVDPGPTTAGVSQVPIWQAFLADYNSLAVSINVPKADKACELFVQNYKLSLLICVDHAAQENGQTVLKFVPVEQSAGSQYWAWPLPDKNGVYAVVPNPLQSYDQKLHTESGMKETFASNYEQGVYRILQVRLPAQFQCREGAWEIIEPGVIQVR